MEKTGEKRELGIILALKLDIYPSISLSPKHTIKVFIVVAILVLEHVLILSTSEVGFTISRGSGSYNPQGVSNGGHGASSLKSQLSFTRPTHSYTTTSFGMDNWDNSNSIVFSAPLSKCSKANIDGDIFNCLSALESQFSLPQTSLEMATMEKLLHIPEDSVACKIRAKRGCATHPRSIAEQNQFKKDITNNMKHTLLENRRNTNQP